MSVRPRSGLALALVLVAGLGACDGDDGHDAGTSLFPLEPGRRWSYRIERSNASGTEVDERAVRIAGTETIQGERYSVRRWSTGVDYYVGVDERGVFRRAKRTFIETEPRLDQSPRFVLRAPYTVGTDWTQDTRAYLLWRPGPDKYDYTRHHVVQMTYTIVAVDETVTVPEGHFTGCMLVSGEGALQVYTDPVAGTVLVPLTTREWYAPGVGLVKVERSEPLDSAAVKGGEWRMELIDFE